MTVYRSFLHLSVPLGSLNAMHTASDNSLLIGPPMKKVVQKVGGVQAKFGGSGPPDPSSGCAPAYTVLHAQSYGLQSAVMCRTSA